jgi:hypothetical protein
MLTTGDDLTRAGSYYALLRLGDYSTLAQMQSFLEQSQREPALQRLRFLSLSMINAIDGSNLNATDRENTIRQLLKLAKSSTDDLRECAIHALRTMAPPEAVPVFVYALDDRVQSIRYDAVLALASIQKKWELAPSIDTFQANESKYISAWKLWWQSEGKLSYPGTTG